MNQQPTNAQGLWVRLYLVPQTDVSEMPPFIEGFLTEETPNAYVLTKMSQFVENDDFEYERQIVDEMNFINRTYVWRCKILDNIEETTEPYNGGGGLG